MFTSFDKALVAFLSSGVYLANSFGFFHLPVEQINTAIVTLTPFLVYLIPNKPKA